MNILTFDTEEWYIEKINYGGRQFRYDELDYKLKVLLDDLEKKNLKATFFCLGKLAEEYPEKIRWIAERGHEIGCHTNTHKWLNKMTPDELRYDTTEAIKRLEDVAGMHVDSFRAPAFSIGPENKWAFEILAECGIKKDASIFPASRDFGGFASFSFDKPCIIQYNGISMKEFPIGVTNFFGKELVFSGGGYFRIYPLNMLKYMMTRSDYNMWYFHLADLISMKFKMKSKKEYEDYFKEPGTFKNRLVRYIKSNIGSGNAYTKLLNLLDYSYFLNLREIDEIIDWSTAKIIKLPVGGIK